MAFQKIYLFLQLERIGKIIVSVAQGGISGTAARKQPHDILGRSAAGQKHRLNGRMLRRVCGHNLRRAVSGMMVKHDMTHREGRLLRQHAVHALGDIFFMIVRHGQHGQFHWRDGFAYDHAVF